MTRKRIGNLKDCVCRTDSVDGSGVAGLSDITIKVDTPSSFSSSGAGSMPKAAKPRKPRSKGTGDHCVISHKGRTVHCYEDQATARRVADSFTKRGKAGTAFTVKNRRSGDDD